MRACTSSARLVARRARCRPRTARRGCRAAPPSARGAARVKPVSVNWFGAFLYLPTPSNCACTPSLSSVLAKNVTSAAQPGDVQDRGGHGVDLRAGGGEVVLLVAAELEVRVGGLARLAEARDGVAQLLDLAPARVGQEAHAQHDRVDLGVARGAVEALHQRAQRRRAAARGSSAARAGRLLGDLAVRGSGRGSSLPAQDAARPRCPRSRRASAPTAAAPMATAATPATRIQAVRFFTGVLASAQPPDPLPGSRYSTRLRASDA